MNQFAKFISGAALLVATLVAAEADAQSFARTTIQPANSGNYQNLGNGVRYNAQRQSYHVPGQAVYKPSGTYNAIGQGYYRNAQTGNVYNPTTGSYSSGHNITFKPQAYQNMGNGTRYNPLTNSTHIPGQMVIKPSGRYDAVGGGYYRNHQTGNIYNPSTGMYKH